VQRQEVEELPPKNKQISQEEKGNNILVFVQSTCWILTSKRLRQLALETIDLKKDPYFMRNHLVSGLSCIRKILMSLGRL